MPFRLVCRSAAALAALLLGAPLSVLRAETRLAYSQRLGIEVLADAPNWCGQAPVLRVTGADMTVFARPELAALLQRIGTDVIAAQCPAATAVTFTGYLPGATSPVWAAIAAPTDGWTPRTGHVEALAAPSPSPLVGEWTGTIGCRNDLRAVVISIPGFEGSAAHGVMQVTPQRLTPGGATRYTVAGSFDMRSGQFDLRSGAVLRPGSDNARPAVGTVADGQIRMGNDCGGSPDVLTRHDGPAVLADRVAADGHRRTEWLEQAAATPRPHRLVGTLAAAPVRQPSCSDLFAWAAVAPLDLRVRILGQGQGILRQFDDVNSARVFGNPAYRWFSTDDNGRRTQSVDLNQVIQAACSTPAIQQDPRYRLLRQVANDGISLNDLALRQHTDDLVDLLPIELATAGGPLGEMYGDLQQFIADPVRMFNNRMRWSSGYLTNDDRAQLIADATRLRAVLAAKAAQAAVVAVKAQPATDAGLRDLSTLVDRFRADFPDDADAVAAAAHARASEIAGQLATETAAAIQDAPRSLDGLRAAQARADRVTRLTADTLPGGAASLASALAALRKDVADTATAAALVAIAASPETSDGLAAQRRSVTDLRRELGDSMQGGGLDAALADLGRKVAAATVLRTVASIAALPPTPDGIRQARALRNSVPGGAADVAVTALVAAATPAVIRDADIRLASAPDSVEGIRAATALREEIRSVLLPEGADAADAFASAVSSRISAIGLDSTAHLAASLAALDVSWTSVDNARALGAEAAAPFAGTEQATALTEMGQQRAVSLIDALADTAAAEMKTVKASNLAELIGGLGTTGVTVRRFSADPSGKEAAARVGAAADARMDALATSVLPSYRAALEAAPPSVAGARKLAQLWAGLEDSPLATRAAFQPYADLAAAGAARLLAGACQSTIGGAGLSPADASRPFVIGNRIGTLGALLCDVSDMGVVHSELKPADDGTFRLSLFLPIGHIGDLTQGRLQPTGAWPQAATVGDLLDLRLPAAKPGDEALLDVAVFVLREIDVAVARKALVPVRVGDQSITEPLTIDDWRQRSEALSPGGAGSAVAPQVCATLRSGGSQMQSDFLAHALLACTVR